jgi:carbonic anhydrase/acetyltransferase-like protein (isoleucine patch superfamily)
MISLPDIARDSLRFFQQCGYGMVRHNTSKIAGRLRKWSLGTNCQIDTAVAITHPTHFHAGLGSALGHGCHIGNKNGRISLGANSHFGAYCHVNVVQGNVTIGDDVAIGPGTCVISYSNQYTPGEDICTSKITDDVLIHDHVFVGANVTILPGTVIESNVVVGAGSVVKGHLKSNGLYVGAPCRRVREFSDKQRDNANVQDV